MDPTRLTRIVGLVNGLHPDLVTIAGDFVAGHDPALARRVAGDLVGPLSGLRAPLGTVATLGNHDQSAAAVIAAALRRAGLTVLNNGAIRRGPLAIVGIDDAFSRHDDVPRSIAAAQGVGGARVVVSHSPDVSPKLPAGFDLVLVGHTHCGQVNLPLIGPPRLFWRRGYRCGVVRRGERTTIITAGLGTSQVPLRWRAPPDLWLLTLGPATGVSRPRP